MSTWTCRTCGTTLNGDLLSGTLDPNIRSGLCPGCKNKRRWFSRPGTGPERKAEGMAAVEAAVHSGSDEAWRQTAKAAALRLAEEGATFTADDIVARAGLPMHRNAVGALLAGLAKTGHIRPAGFTAGRRPEQHARMIRQWTGPFAPPGPIT